MQRIQEFCEVIKEAFYLQSFTMNIVQQPKDNDRSLCTISMDHVYQVFNITIYPSFFNQTRQDQASSLFHEFIHTFNLPIYNCLRELQSGSFITDNHANEINEIATVRGEKMMIYLMTKNTLQVAFNKFVKESVKPSKKKLLSRKQAPKMPQKV